MAGRKRQDKISTYRPGLVEKATDATIGAAIRKLHRLTGASEKDAYRYANDVLRNIEDVTGLKAAERAVRSIARGKGTKQDYLTVGLTAVPAVGGAVAKRAVGKVTKAVSSPSISNRMYNEKLLGPEWSASNPNLPRYGYRNVSSPSEIDDIARSGYMRPAPGKKPNKYFTMSDAETPSVGNRGSKPVLRVNSENIPQGSPVRRQHVQQWDETSESWKPIKRKAKGGTVKPSKSAKNRGDGIAQRGKTKGKIR
jgi:hypothetical protein